MDTPSDKRWILTEEEAKACAETRAHEFILEVWKQVSADYYNPEFCLSNVREALRLYFEQIGIEPPEPQ